jgi:hypothetical protein
MGSILARRVCCILLVILGYAVTAAAQQFSFGYRTSANANPVGIQANGELDAAPTNVGQSSSLTLIIINNTTATWSVTNATTNGPVFKVSGGAAPIAPGASGLIPVTFSPTTGNTVTDDLNVQLANGSQNVTYDFVLKGTGLKPNFIPSYILNPNGNQIALSPGASISFPNTNVNSTQTATFVIVNSGTGAGTVNAVSLTGTGFQLSGLPLLPATVQPNTDLRFTITFTPTSRGSFTGSLSVDLVSTQLSVPLLGQATGASLTYSATIGTAVSALSSGGSLALPSANIGSSSTATIKVTNTGDSNGTINSVNIIGTGFSVANIAPLPATLAPNASFVFDVVFKPQVSGNASGTLIIDGFSISVTGVGVGASLTFSSVIGSTVTAIANGGVVVFPNTNIGATSTVSIRIDNTGNAPATVSGISISGTSFSIRNLPALPATINAGANLVFTVAYTANTAGTVSTTLQIDNFAITLRGSGNTPPPLGSIAFASLPANANALDQPSVGISLSQPYPLDITGKLTLSFTSDSFADDPNIQFASGGRTVSFTIPANTLNAVFGTSGQVQFQAGTVSGVIAVTASFALGGVDITPSPAPSQSVVVVSATPQIRNVQIGTRTTNSFELLVTGLSTSRSVTQINLQFTPAQGANLQTTSLSINTQAPFSTWFQSTTGISFGSQFTASVIVNVTGDINAVQSVSLTASSARGDSTPMSVNLH